MARAWSLKARPQGMPKHTDFAMIDLDQATLGAGEVRIANRWLSVDPYMRGRMNDVPSYVAPFRLNEAMDGRSVGEVVASRSDAARHEQFALAAAFLPEAAAEHTVVGAEHVHLAPPARHDEHLVTVHAYTVRVA